MNTCHLPYRITPPDPPERLSLAGILRELCAAALDHTREWLKNHPA